MVPLCVTSTEVARAQTGRNRSLHNVPTYLLFGFIQTSSLIPASLEA